MRLSWNEVRARAAAFAEEWADAHYERGETQSFYNDFFEVFGVRRRQVATFEEPVKKLGDRQGFIDLFWKGVLLVEQKSAGRNLARAKEQALDYFPGLKPMELPRYILVSDFQTFDLYDLETDEALSFRLAELPAHVERFGFVMGVERRTFRDQDPANILASELMAKVHDGLLATGYGGSHLERYLVRLLFCLFADDTGIFPRDAFQLYVTDRTREDGSDLGPLLAKLWEVLDMAEDHPRRAAMDEDLRAFPYVNGALFRERLDIPDFDRTARERLLEACGFKWDLISPAIFGSLFQAVMNKGERRKKGAHYTTEKNILKLIGPLFLDDLRAEFERIKAMANRERRLKELADLHEKLGKLTFLDPACGCGNFLVITYRELRRLETELLVAQFKGAGLAQADHDFDVGALTRIKVDAFYGIELEEFPARIAEVALWMADHIENNRLSLEFGRAYARIPLVTAPHIVHGDALELDWTKVLSPERCSYVLGNPPFIGAKFQSEAQRAQVRKIAQLPGSGGTLDYVAAWFLKAGDYAALAARPERTPDAPGEAERWARATTGNLLGEELGVGEPLGGAIPAIPDRPAPKIAFVSTNSITQGEQVAQLWPPLFRRARLEIAFAHRTFAWGSDARGVAHVHVVIVGLARRGQEPAEKRLFSYEKVDGDPVESRHAALTPYLFGAEEVQDRHLVVKETSRPLTPRPKLISGSQPIDGGHLIFNAVERFAFLEDEPGASPYMRPFIGADEYISGMSRYILALQGIEPDKLKKLPSSMARLRAVRDFRRLSKRVSTLAIVDYPERFNVTVVPSGPFLALPEVSSSRRKYVPIGWLEPPTVPSNLLRVIEDASLSDFGVLTSAMHTSWLRYIGGRLKSDYRYSIGLVYNTFPWPTATSAQRKKVEALAQAVLDARAAHPDATLADLYDPDLMPPDLRRAHRKLDEAVDRLYRRTPFAGDRDRAEHLFGLYERLTAGLLATPAKAKRARRTSAA